MSISRRDKIKMKIEKNIPIPPRQCRYPELVQMEIGDSILIKEPRGSVQNTVCRIGKRLGVKFTTRQMNHGVRVWRVK